MSVFNGLVHLFCIESTQKFFDILNSEEADNEVDEHQCGAELRRLSRLNSSTSTFFTKRSVMHSAIINFRLYFAFIFFTLS